MFYVPSAETLLTCMCICLPSARHWWCGHLIVAWGSRERKQCNVAVSMLCVCQELRVGEGRELSPRIYTVVWCMLLCYMYMCYVNVGWGCILSKFKLPPYLVSLLFWCSAVPTSCYTFLTFSSGNCTSGSRSYSDLVDTWADSVCIHQLVPKPCSKSTSTMALSN